MTVLAPTIGGGKHTGGQFPLSSCVPDNSQGSENVSMGTIRRHRPFVYMDHLMSVSSSHISLAKTTMSQAYLFLQESSSLS